MVDLTGKRLIVVSNRLPVAVAREDNNWQVKPSSGGLVTALAPLVRSAGGLWIGWPGCSEKAPVDELLASSKDLHGFDLIPVKISEREADKYYRGFSNGSIWPLFHDLLGQFTYDLDEWSTYLQVNERFAQVVAQQMSDDCVLWVNDYQLLYVGHYLRKLGVNHYIHFFLHIPFPSIDLLRRFPQKRDLVRAMLSYDHIGFQTPNDHRNFINSVKLLLPEATRERRRRRSSIHLEEREILTGFYPISIDFAEFNDGARSKEVAEAAWYLRENLHTPVLALGIDRLDYTKGVPERYLAFERMLEKYPEVRGKISLLQIVVPSRLKVPDYRDLKEQLDYLAGRINSRFAQGGWVPIYYEFRELDRIQLLAHYRACEIALITPLRDGMNLVAKEYCASSIENNGVLILSEFAGAATQLSKGAIVVNPYNTDATADAIYAAYLMPPEERRRRMKILRSEVERYDVKRWVDWILNPSQSSTNHVPMWPAAHDLPTSDQAHLKVLPGKEGSNRKTS